MPKLLEEVRSLIRLRHYSHRTEKTYTYWIKQFIFYHGLSKGSALLTRPFSVNSEPFAAWRCCKTLGYLLGGDQPSPLVQVGKYYRVNEMDERSISVESQSKKMVCVR
jgi:hypothetical protein